MTPEVLAAFFTLSAWGSPCQTYTPPNIRLEWHSPYNQMMYVENCGNEMREVIITEDVSFHRYGITYLAHSEWLRDLPDIENFSG